MKIRKVINHSGIGELFLPMVLEAFFFSVEVWKSGKATLLFSILFNLNVSFGLVIALHL